MSKQTIPDSALTQHVIALGKIRIVEARRELEARGGVKKDTTPRATIPLAERFVRPVVEGPKA